MKLVLKKKNYETCSLTSARSLAKKDAPRCTRKTFRERGTMVSFNHSFVPLKSV